MKKKTLASSKILIAKFIVQAHSTHQGDRFTYTNGFDESVDVEIYKKEVKNMGKELAEYPSSSNPAKTYHIILGADGVTYCDCMGWKMNKHCKHLDDYLGKASGKVIGAHKIKPTLAKKDPEVSLNKTIDKIVEEIKQGGA